MAQDWGKIITQFGMVTMENIGNGTYAHTSGNTSNLAVKVIAGKLQCLWRRLKIVVYAAEKQPVLLSKGHCGYCVCVCVCDAKAIAG